jgi:hypothetical protein
MPKRRHKPHVEGGGSPEPPRSGWRVEKAPSRKPPPFTMRGGAFGRTKRYVSPLPIKDDDPDTQYRRCGICKVRGTDGYAKFIARLPGRTNWINLCEEHFKEYGCKLGPEHGQELIVNPAWADQMSPQEKENLKIALSIKGREEEVKKARLKKARERRRT